MKKEFTPIAMRCTQEQFDSIKPKLKNAGLKIEKGCFYSYLTNDFNGRKIVAFTQCNTEDYADRITHETWNEKIFLEACGIEVDFETSIRNLTK